MHIQKDKLSFILILKQKIYQKIIFFGTLINKCKFSWNVLTEAFITSVEAKTVALSNLKIPSQYSNEYATGTGTDGLCIFSNWGSENNITNEGMHSKLGELIGKVVIKSVIIVLYHKIVPKNLIVQSSK